MALPAVQLLVQLQVFVLFDDLTAHCGASHNPRRHNCGEALPRLATALFRDKRPSTRRTDQGHGQARSAAVCPQDLASRRPAAFCLNQNIKFPPIN